ncbi:hypothetical protein COW36_00275 [bacterium (Candidatus Blackallbacteria) CG17_big_fil_post_rev_8_21_14_2_50_48_46]|uniref:Uncharacterized protein n=1 Tax=bacterium (Candidatus Blackallbacteria) CG17_big_fil_post_rev_8_21_14_2_50_48_46 TaxID=2014261 RepID=A0A2M7GAV6_9BACT|nr:MAG: hypothetical protein COW64_10895 [bacterium (Candidatus Blackallbacteria) CG18_big_fil_WC_8_21_14_2_50_49_26]PIW19311.1 MAG: hypothetical protein COW36_00275 [bacterium (Candidatus Blackallbacteria) CG17_big_fil_post_rev_8_21_14_2_50_48_46]PIW49085.1 MAG: hypothetical protein COW20_08180 [bacterium (Candidatus Blackallbacteria) CG13_big_fil_rev_8_21_14_2_50_49_14]
MPEMAALKALLKHLQACPAALFRPQAMSDSDWQNHLAAQLTKQGIVPQAKARKQLQKQLPSCTGNLLDWIGPLLWLLKAPCFQTGPKPPLHENQEFIQLAESLASFFPVRQILLNPQRAEECLRWLCAQKGLILEGESPEESARILNYLSSPHRAHLYQARTQYLQRQEAIRRAEQRLAQLESPD